MKHIVGEETQMQYFQGITFAFLFCRVVKDLCYVGINDVEWVV